MAIKEEKAVNDLLEFYPVKSGDFFFVPMEQFIIGSGVLLAEVQQRCGVTYRVWDWTRKGLDGKPRELHIDKAMEVINFDDLNNEKRNFRFKENVFEEDEVELADHPDFHFKLFKNIKTVRPSGNVPNGLINFSKEEVQIEQGSEKISLNYLECALIKDLNANLSLQGKEISIGQVY